MYSELVNTIKSPLNKCWILHVFSTVQIAASTLVLLSHAASCLIGTALQCAPPKAAQDRSHVAASPLQ